MSSKTADPKTKRELEIKLQFELIECGQFPTCYSCVHFNEEHEVCQKFGGKRPPIKWILTGCVEWEAGIPF